MLWSYRSRRKFELDRTGICSQIGFRYRSFAYASVSPMSRYRRQSERLEFQIHHPKADISTAVYPQVQKPVSGENATDSMLPLAS